MGALAAASAVPHVEQALVSGGLEEGNDTDAGHVNGSGNAVSPRFFNFSAFEQCEEVHVWENLLARSQVYALVIPSRRTHIARLLLQWGFLGARLVDGPLKADVDLEDLAREGRALCNDTVTPARAACHLGHLSILQEFLNLAAEKELALIFEDDLEDRPPKEMRTDICKFFSAVPQDFDILYLGFLWESKDEREKVNDFVYRCSCAVGRHAYLVTRRGAEVLLRETRLQDAPGDQMYLRTYQKGELVAYQPVDPIFRQDRVHFASELSWKWRP